MPGKFHHEHLYRGTAVAEKLRSSRITLCGAGALGSNLAENLARQGAGCLRAIDHDRVEEHNIGTQVYGEGDVGRFKVEALGRHLFRVCGIEPDGQRKQLSAANAPSLLKGSDLIVDCFDNSTGRSLVQMHARQSATATLHVGLFEGYAEVIWDERYRVPAEVGGDVCDYALARNLVLLVVAVASETILGWLATGERRDWSITLKDLAVRPMDK